MKSGRPPHRTGRVHRADSSGDGLTVGGGGSPRERIARALKVIDDTRQQYPGAKCTIRCRDGLIHSVVASLPRRSLDTLANLLSEFSTSRRWGSIDVSPEGEVSSTIDIRIEL